MRRGERRTGPPTDGLLETGRSGMKLNDVTRDRVISLEGNKPVVHSIFDYMK